MPILQQNVKVGINMRRIYWDSCIFIYRVQTVDPWKHTIERLLLDIPDFRLVLTELTRLECLVLPTRTNDSHLHTLYEQIFSLPIIQDIALDRSVFHLATELRANDRIKTPDAIHLAAALVAGCDEFWTNDDRLAKAAKGRIHVINVNSPT